MEENFVLKSANRMSDWHIYDATHGADGAEASYCGHPASDASYLWPHLAEQAPKQYLICRNCLAAASQETKEFLLAREEKWG